MTKNALMLHLIAQGFVLANSVKDSFLKMIDRSVVPPGDSIRIHRGTYWLPGTNWVALEDAGYPYGATIYLMTPTDRRPWPGYKVWHAPIGTKVVVLDSTYQPMFPTGRMDVTCKGTLIFSVVSSFVEDNR